MNIDYLYNHPEYVEIVSNWIYNEFVVKLKGTAKFEKIIKFFSNTNLTSLPVTFIAKMEKKCAGTVSIFENDLKTQKDLIPWLALLYVNPDHRGQGVGRMLIARVLQEVKELGFNTVYLRTEHASEYYRKLGWEFVYKTHDEKGQETEVFKFNVDK